MAVPGGLSAHGFAPVGSVVRTRDGGRYTVLRHNAANRSQTIRTAGRPCPVFPEQRWIAGAVYMCWAPVVDGDVVVS